MAAGVDVAGDSPLVVLARVNSRPDVVDVVEGLQAGHAGSAFVAVVPAADLFDDALIVDRLTAVVREFIFCDSGADRSGSGAELALHAVDQLGVGQDFAYTVPRLVDAIDYALTVLRSPGRRGWEGTALLVIGSATTIDLARGHVG